MISVLVLFCIIGYFNTKLILMKYAFLLVLIMLSTRALTQPISAPLHNPVEVEEASRLENLQNSEVLILTPHPDDETFSMGGTIARLVENGNNIRIIIYTNDNKGSQDLTMTRERLATIRRAEEEKACDILGVPSENLIWLGYEDGDLEYADPYTLRGTLARLIKMYQPDVMFTPDPGTTWTQWHKSDHRLPAYMGEDAMRAANWHLYYPQHLLDEGLKPYKVPVVYFYYSREPNYEIDITDYFEKKARACAAHVSQFEPSVSAYTPDMSDEVYQQIRDGFAARNRSDNGALVERFRRVMR